MDSGTEVGKVVYKVQIDTDNFDSQASQVTRRIEELPDNKEVKLNFDWTNKDVVAEWEQSQQDIETISRSILNLTQSLGDLNSDAATTSQAIARLMSEFSAAGGDVESLTTKLQEMGSAAGINSDGNLFNSLYEYRDHIAELKGELDILSEGTELYTAKQASLAQVSIELQQKLHELDETYKPLYTDMQSYTEYTEKAAEKSSKLNEETTKLADSGTKAGTSVQNLAAKLASIGAAFATLRKSVAMVTESIEEYCSVQDDIAAANPNASVGQLSASWQELSNSISNVKITIGSLFEPFAGIISSIATWISENRELVASLAVGVTTALSVIAAVGVATAVIKVLTTVVATLGSTVAIATAGISVLLGVLGGLASYAMLSGSAVDDNAVSMADADKQAKAYADRMTKLQKSTASATKSTKDFSEQLAKLRRNYLESLKQIEVDHQSTIDSLKTDLEDLRQEYNDTVAQRNADFEITMLKEQRSHEELVDELTAQLDFLQRYNNGYNAEKLAKVQFALEKEQALYAQETAARQAELDLQNEADAAAYEKRRQAMEDELNEELAFMEKHRGDLQEVRDVILLDEIDMLKRQYEEQKSSYLEQQSLATSNAATINKTYEDYYQEFLDNMKTSTTEMTNTVGKGANTALGKLTSEWSRIINDFLNWANKGLDNFFSGGTSKIGTWIQSVYNNITGHGDLNKDLWGNYYSKQSSGSGWAYGGYTGAGSKFEVAGVVHRGEYVIPQEDVDQSTGLPKLGTTQNITINVDGVFATSAQERRHVAEQIAEALGQLNKAGRTQLGWQ